MIEIPYQTLEFGGWGRSGRSLVVLLQTCRRPVVEAHAEGQTTGGQNVLDFGQGLLAQIRRLQQLHFGALDQVTDVVDVLCLEAVGRTHGQLQVIDRAQQDRIDLVFLLHNFRNGVTLEVDERGQLLLQDGRGTADGLFGIQGTVGFQIDDQLVQVGALLDTGVFHHVGNATDRAEGSVELKTADAAAFVFVALAGIGRDIATTASHLELHVQGTVVRQIGNHVVAVDDFDIVIQLNIGGGDHARALLREAQRYFVAAVQLDGQALEVQEDLDDIFLNTFDGAVLVEYAIDLGLYHCTARHGGQQDATQRVAQGMAKATLERLERDLGAGRTDHLNVDVTGGQELIYRTLHGCTYFLALTWSRARQSGFR